MVPSKQTALAVCTAAPTQTSKPQTIPGKGAAFLIFLLHVLILDAGPPGTYFGVGQSQEESQNSGGQPI